MLRGSVNIAVRNRARSTLRCCHERHERGRRMKLEIVVHFTLNKLNLTANRQILLYNLIINFISTLISTCHA